MDLTREDGTINSTMVSAALTKLYNKLSTTIRGEGLQTSLVNRLFRLLRLFLRDNYTDEQIIEWVRRKI